MADWILSLQNQTLNSFGEICLNCAQHKHKPWHWALDNEARSCQSKQPLRLSRDVRLTIPWTKLAARMRVGFVMPLALLEKGFTLLPEESVVLFDGTPCGWTDGVFFSFWLALRSFAVTGKFLTSRHPALFDGMSNHDSLRLKLSLPNCNEKR